MSFTYVLRPSFDRDFLASATPAQYEIFQRHGAYLEELHARGVVRFAGRCLDGPFGLVVLETTDEAAARRLMTQDPSVSSGVQQAELYEFAVFLEGPLAEPQTG
ncbi:YciI family protein [Jatrophihabitans sp. DSM 45814]